jgi:TonB family protein
MTMPMIPLASEKDSLLRSAGLAVGVELFFFLALGLGHLSLFHNRFEDAVDAQIVQLSDAHLAGAQATSPDDDVVFNPRHKPKPAKKPEPPKSPEQNQVEAGPDLGPTHGPVALYAPQPVIPAYLRGQNLKTSVVIEFLITAGGQVTCRLLESSGSDELDALSIETAEKWRFKPAAQDNVPIDSKTRLRITFEVQ